MDGKATPSRYNDITVIKPPTDPNAKPKRRDYWDDDVDEKDYKDPFKVSTNNGGRIMPEYVEAPTHLIFPSCLHIVFFWNHIHWPLLFHHSQVITAYIIPRTCLAIQWPAVALNILQPKHHTYDQIFSRLPYGEIV